MNFVEVSAKKVDDAISQGLVELRATIDQVKVEIIDSGGIFKKARVRLTLDEEEQARRDKKAQKEQEATKAQVQTQSENIRRQETRPQAVALKQESKPQEQKQEKRAFEQRPQTDNKAQVQKPLTQNDKKPSNQFKDKPQERQQSQSKPQLQKQERPQRESKFEISAEIAQGICDFVQNTIKLMGVEGKVSYTVADELKIDIQAAEGSEGIVIGYRGETLSALQYLAQLSVQSSDDKFVRLSLNCNGFRERRELTLTNLAKRTAEKCIKTGRRIKLEPMDRNDRRIIHNALTGDERIVTKSEGNEPYRRIIIMAQRSAK